MESVTSSGLVWKWILEYLAYRPGFESAAFNEAITMYIADIEEPHCRPILETAALKLLEDMVVKNRIDSNAIPLLKQLTGQDLGPRETVSSSAKQRRQSERFQNELLLDVRTEVVLSVLRKDVDEGQKDWALYEAELELVFEGAEEDNRLLERKRELSALLKPKNQTEANVAAFLNKYSLKNLRKDLSSFIDEKREPFKTMFLNQLLRDFRDTNGKPFTEDVEKSTHVEFNGKQDHVRQNPVVNEIGDQHIVLETATTSGKKRRRQKHLPTQDDIVNDVSDEAEEDSARMKKSSSQLLRDFRDTNGKPFTEDVEKSTHVESNGKQGHVRQNPVVNEIGDQHIVLETATTSGKKRRRQKHLPTQDDIVNDVSDEAEEDSARMKKSSSQLLRDFRDTNGKPFTEDVEKSTHVESNGKQGHVRQNPVVNEIGDQHIVLESATTSGKKRQRQKLLPTQDDIVNDVSDEADEDSARMKKSREMPAASTVKPVLGQDVSELPVLASGHQNGCIPVNREVESGKQLSLLNRGDEHASDLRSLKRRSCSPLAKKSISMQEVKTSPRELRCKKKYVEISDVDSDAPTQVIMVLSSDDEDSVKGDGDMLKTKGNLSLHENGSDRERPQNNVKAEVVRKGIFTVQSEQMVLLDRVEASTSSPEVKSSPQEDQGKSVIKNKAIPLDAQDGTDGHEEVCHTCGGSGKLIRGEEGLISMRSEEAVKTATEAKKNPKASKTKSQKGHSSSKGGNNGQEKAGQQSRLAISSLEFEENDRALKAMQHIDSEAIPGQQGSDPFVSAVMKRAFHQLKLRDSDHASSECKPDSNRVVSVGQGAGGKNVGRAVRVSDQSVNASPKSLVENGALSMRDESAKPVPQNEDETRIPHTAQPSHDREVPRKVPCAASASGDVGSLSERVARFSRRNGSPVDRGEKNSEKTDPRVPEPASGSGGRREVEDESDDDELEEDSSEGRNQVALPTGRRKCPGIRRKSLPWTKDEEKILKEGVRRFSHNGTWGFQWTRILQFGKGIFEPTRTSVDLKDKWRNLCKAVA